MSWGRWGSVHEPLEAHSEEQRVEDWHDAERQQSGKDQSENHAMLMKIPAGSMRPSRAMKPEYGLARLDDTVTVLVKSSPIRSTFRVQDHTNCADVVGAKAAIVAATMARATPSVRGGHCAPVILTVGSSETHGTKGPPGSNRRRTT